MRKILLSTVMFSFAALNAGAQFYIQAGATVTIENSATLYSDGDASNSGTVNGNGFLSLTGSATQYIGTGSIRNLQIHGGANVTPANNVHLLDKLDVTSGSTLTIPPNQHIRTDGNLTNAGIFNVENTASLVQGPSSGLTNTGTFNVRKQGNTAWNVYNYWSSPVVAGIAPGAYRYRWDPNTSTQDYADDLDPDPGWHSFSGVMTVGQGYAGSGAGLVNFTGTVNNGTYSFPMVYHPFAPGNTNPGTPYNLMGNPYPSAIRCLDLVNANADIDGALYFWDDDLSGGTGYWTTDYAVWNGTGSLGTGAGLNGIPNGFISTGQGFMARALNSSATLDVNNQMRVDALNASGYANNQMFKLESEIQRLYMSLEGDGRFNQILIGMVDDATDGQDRLYDALKMRGNQSISLGAQLFEGDDKEFSILGFPPPFANKTIPLKVFVDQAGVYEFRANSIEGYDGYDLYLEDRSDFSYYPIYEGVQLPFQIAEGDVDGRFFLHIGSELVTGVRDVQSPAMRAWIYDGMLNVNLYNFLNMQGQLEMLDMAGRLVWTSGSGLHDRFSADVSSLSRGAYLVRLVSPTGIFTEKVLR